MYCAYTTKKSLVECSGMQKVEEELVEQVEEQSVHIENQKKITLSGVLSIEGFTTQQIILELATGKVIVFGSSLKIAGFTKAGGQFIAIGNIKGLRFCNKQDKFLKRLFK